MTRENTVVEACMHVWALDKCRPEGKGGKEVNAKKKWGDGRTNADDEDEEMYRMGKLCYRMHTYESKHA